MSERIVSGSVRGDGKVLDGQGFHASRTASGRYLIVFRPPLYEIMSGMAHLIDTRQAGHLTAKVSSLDGLHASITVTDPSEEPHDCAFSFVFSGHAHDTGGPQPADPMTPAQVIPTPAIGSPSPPVLSFPRQPDTAPDIAPASLASQIEKLKQTMQDVLRPLQRENRMLKSRLSMAARQANGGRKVISAANAFPQIAAGPLLTRLLREYVFHTVLDLGLPDLQRLTLLAQQDRRVTAIAGTSLTAVSLPNVQLAAHVPQPDSQPSFDCVVAIDVLQRHSDPQAFLRSAHEQLMEGGVLALSVPAMRYPQVTGDLSIWSGGLLLQHLVLAGFDCRNVQLLPQEEHLYILVVKSSIPPVPLDRGKPQMKAMQQYLPTSLDYMETPEGLAFNGDLPAIGWAP